MKILLINYEFPPLGGGGGVACYQIARELAKKHRVDYLTTSFKELPQFEVVDGINVYRVPVLGRKGLSTSTLLSMLTFFPSSLIKGFKLCGSKQYDIINAHFAVPSGPTGILLSMIFNIPLVISVHGGDIYDPSKKSSPHKHLFLRAIITRILNNSDKIVAQSGNTKFNTLKYYRPNKDITIIPLGFIVPNFRRVTREELEISDEDIVLVSVGRLIKRKGYEEALKALSELNNKNVKYLIMGEGPEEENLKGLTKRLGLENSVKFLGYVPEEKKFQYLSVSDIYILSSLHEGFGICLLEAMYCGLPIVSTDNGGQTDFLHNGRNSLMVPIGDSRALASEVRKLILNPDLMAQIGKKNREDIKKFYIEEISIAYEKLFNEIIN